MTVTRIKVGNKPPSAADVLDFAAALIEAYGWNNLRVSGKNSSEQAGFSLHDSIGEACTRLSKAVGQPPSKDWTVGADNLRVKATNAIMYQLHSRQFPGDDIAFNDAPDASEEAVLAVLRDAQEVVQ